MASVERREDIGNCNILLHNHLLIFPHAENRLQTITSPMVCCTVTTAGGVRMRTQDREQGMWGRASQYCSSYVLMGNDLLSLIVSHVMIRGGVYDFLGYDDDIQCFFMVF